MEFNIELTLYFEIRDSYIYGGTGSEGYSSVSVGFNQINYESDNVFNKKEIMEGYIASQTKAVASLSRVPIECVRLISKEEYEENTDEEEV